MAYFRPIYVVFNQCECLIWWAFGLYFVYLVASKQPRGALLLPELALILGFAFFGFSDYIESTDSGGLPRYLWIWKIVNGTALFALLVWRDYSMRGRIALRPWRFVAAGTVLGLAIYQAIFHSV
jgi:hypothetical protein